MNHLQDRSYYEDLYDRQTVDRCRFHEKHSKQPPKIIKTNRSTLKMTSNIGEFLLSLEKGERYYRKNEVINKWMDRDREKDQIIANSSPPKTVSCSVCSSEMELLDSELVFYDVKTPHMKYSFGCRSCQTMSDFAQGHRKDSFPWQCPKCKRRMKSKTVGTKRRFTTTNTCECGYRKVDTLDLDELHELLKKDDPDPAEEQKYHEDKLRFCLTPEEARNYIDMRTFMANIQSIMDKKPMAVEVPAVEELTLSKLKERLKAALEGKGYSVASFGKPQLEENVSISLTATDEKGRTAFTSKKEFRKTLNDCVEGSNWKLVKPSVKEKLGVLKAKFTSFDRRSIRL